MDTYENNIPQEEEIQTLQEELEQQEPQAEVIEETQAEVVEETQEEVVEEPQEEVPQQIKTEAPQETKLTEAPRRKKVSPFEDSPYIPYRVPQQTYAPSKPKKRRTLWKPLVALAVAACLVIGTCAITADVVNTKWENRVEDLTEKMEAQMASLEQKIEGSGEVVLVPGNTDANSQNLYTPSQVYAANVKSVVMIYNKVSSQGGMSVSTGSGFIITADGFVVTNQHVVDGGGSITVITTDGTEYSAVLVGEDSTNDVALLKVQAQNLRPVTLGSSADLVVGDQVAAIGNPLGELTSTLTVGYISAKERDVTTDGFAINMLQTDAAINSGNSGGPLFNMRGEVIGITTAKYSGTSSSGATIEGVGFAIPIDDVVDILSDLAAYGHVTGGYLGVMVSDMDPDAAAYYGIPVGAYVQEVTPGYAAQKAGLRAKDIIVELGGYTVRNVNGLTRALRHFKGGDETTIVVYRGGQKLTLTVVLDEKPVEETTTVPETTPQGGTGNGGSGNWWDNILPPNFGNNG